MEKNNEMFYYHQTLLQLFTLFEEVDCIIFGEGVARRSETEKEEATKKKNQKILENEKISFLERLKQKK
jgi:hypothetical protein